MLDLSFSYRSWYVIDPFITYLTVKHNWLLNQHVNFDGCLIFKVVRLTGMFKNYQFINFLYIFITITMCTNYIPSTFYELKLHIRCRSQERVFSLLRNKPIGGTLAVWEVHRDHKL